jgi:hypothetical protein
MQIEDEFVFDETFETPSKKQTAELLMKLPKMIRNKEVALLAHSNNVSLHDEEMEQFKAGVMRDITKEIKEDGTKLCKNETERQAELAKRLISNIEYKNARSNWEHNKLELEKGRIQLEYLKSQFSAARYLCKLFGGNE